MKKEKIFIKRIKKVTGARERIMKDRHAGPAE